MTTLWLQPGHGEDDPGATHGKRTEAGQAKKLVDEAVELAKPHLAEGHSIRKMRNRNYVTAVDIFTKRAGDLDLYLEVHFNSNAGEPGSGTEVLYGHKPTAETLQEALVEELGLPDRGVKQRDDLYVTTAAIAGGQVSGVIVEMAFINNDEDMEVIQDRGAGALATALVSLSYGTYTPLESDAVLTQKEREYRDAWQKEAGRRQNVEEELDTCRSNADSLQDKLLESRHDYDAAIAEIDDLKAKLEGGKRLNRVGKLLRTLIGKIGYKEK